MARNVFVPVIFILFAFPLLLHANTWIMQDPALSDYDLSAIKCVDLSKAWAIGRSGTLLRSTVQGVSWQKQPTPYDSLDFSQIEAVSNKLWIVSRDIPNRLLLSRDNGSHWSNITPLFGTQLLSLSFSDTMHGWLIDYANTTNTYRLLKTTNGGINWDTCFSTNTDQFTTVKFFDNNYGWIFGTNNSQTVTRYTTDGGLHWGRNLWRSGNPFLGMQAVDSTFAWTYRNGNGISEIWQTDNWGQMWVYCSADTVVGGYQGSEFIGHNHAWLFNQSGRVRHTSNGGATWSTQQIPTSVAINDIEFADSINGIAIGNNSLSYFTTDGGVHWQYASSRYQTYNNAIFVFNPSTCMIYGSESFSLSRFLLHGYLTTDRGQNWTHRTYTAPKQIADVAFIDENNGWAVGSNLFYTLDPSEIYRTGDGGLSWELRYTDTVSSPSNVYSLFTGVSFVGSQYGWIAGNDFNQPYQGVLLRTTNGGAEWIRQLINVSPHFGHCIDFVDRWNGWCVGCSGVIIHTTDGGVSWNNQTTPDAPQLTCVRFLNRVLGFAGGGLFSSSSVNSCILRTTNGGINWTVVFNRGGCDILDLCFPDVNHGWAVGNSGSIFKTTDGGNSWSSDQSGTNLSLYKVDFCDSLNGWIIGQYGTILHTSSGGQTWVEEPRQISVPSLFSLHPNYPNPFNSSTTISYSLPTSGNIDLKVFDLQGREISTLDQGYRRAGNYKLNFDSKALSSGNYFIRLSEGQTTVTKKMIVLK